MYYFTYGPSPSYRFNEAGPYDTRQDAAEAARNKRAMGYSTSRPEKRDV